MTNNNNEAKPAAGERYTQLAIALHWIIALLFLGSYMAVYYRHWFTVKKTPENWTALQLHLAIGITIGAFVLLRVIWRAFNKPPALPPGPTWEHNAAHSAHFVLYAFMIVMPITGYLGTGAPTDYFAIPMFKDTQLFHSMVEGTLGLTWKEWEAPLDFVHKRSGEYLLWGLILIHAAAALYHQYVKRDNLLARMGIGS